MKKRTNANAYDVAKKAGVSQSTVSRVLNNYPHIKETTRRKVLQAIEELNFTRDEIARSLAEKKTRTIGLIIGDITNPFYAESSKIIMKKANELAYDIIIGYTDYRDTNLDKAIQTMIGKRVDGILIATTERTNKKIPELYRSGFPTVLYNALIDDQEQSNFVVVDNEKGAYMAMEHLIQLGHTKISYISGPQSFLNLSNRHTGYKKALSDYKIPYDESNIYQENLNLSDIVSFVEKLLDKRNRPTAIFAGSDQIALTVMDTILKRGLKVPEDISVIGFDDISLSSNHLINLSTVSQNMVEMATLALNKLLMMIEEQIDEQRIQLTIDPILKIRKTTGPIKIKNE
ncbi:LacI family DNA-binding transcriptional regulator [Metabacillus sp. Hm71]|uniref:LacI family DNA-binding transcriptional regulator n=1 Tax=Metabacillus sp. Hm71 TaxID=3450743 RepID=UPI003F4212D0